MVRFPDLPARKEPLFPTPPTLFAARLSTCFPWRSKTIHSISEKFAAGAARSQNTSAAM